MSKIFQPNEAFIEHKSSSLLEAYALLSGGKIELLSLDIFDTLLWRKIKSPADAFIILGRQLKESKIIQAYVSVELFQQARIVAEKNARCKNGANDEITISDIYQCMPESIIPSHNRDAALESEILLEISLIELDPLISNIILLAAQENIPYILVSDMYLPGPTLKRLVASAFSKWERYGQTPLPFPTQIFASCDFKTNKTNDLFRLVLSHYQDIDPSLVMHIGDHPYADCEKPSSIGLKAICYRKKSDLVDSIINKESALARFCSHRNQYDQGADGGLLSLRLIAGDACKFDNYFERAGALIYGPALYCYANWVVERAQALKAMKVFCFLREGVLLAELVGLVAEKKGIKLNATEVALSRGAVMRAAVREGTIEIIKELINVRGALSLAEALNFLGIGDFPKGDLPEELQQSSNSNLSEEERSLLYDFCLKNKVVKNAIINNAKQQSKLLIKYLISIDFISSIKKNHERIVCDLGWGGTIQRYLGLVFEAEDIDCSLHGLYLLTNKHILSAIKGKHYAEGYLSNPSMKNGEELLFGRSPEMIEGVVNAPTGSVWGYNENGPIFQELRLSCRQLQESAAAKVGIRKFANLALLYNVYSLPVGIDEARYEDTKRLESFLPILRAIVMPEDYEIEAYSEWSHETNLSSTYLEKLLSIEKVSPEQTMYFPDSFLSQKAWDKNFYWQSAGLKKIWGDVGIKLYIAHLMQFLDNKDISEICPLGVDFGKFNKANLFAKDDIDLSISFPEVLYDEKDSEPFLLHSIASYLEILTRLFSIVGANSIVEVGAENAKITAKLVEYLRPQNGKVLTVEPFPGVELEEFAKKNPERVILYKGISLDYFKNIETFFDAVILDGDHNYYTVLNELKLITDYWEKNEKKDGVIIVHDVGFPCARRDQYYHPQNIPSEFLKPHSFFGAIIPGNKGFAEAGLCGCGQFAYAEEEDSDKNGVKTAIEDFVAANPNYYFYVLAPVFGIAVLVRKDNPYLDEITSYLQPLQSELLERMEKNRIALYIRVIQLESAISSHNKIASKHIAELKKLSMLPAKLEITIRNQVRHALIELRTLEKEVQRLKNSISGKSALSKFGDIQRAGRSYLERLVRGRLWLSK